MDERGESAVSGKLSVARLAKCLTFGAFFNPAAV